MNLINVTISLTGFADSVKSMQNFFNNLNQDGRLTLILVALCICAILWFANNKKTIHIEIRRLEIIDSRRNILSNMLKWLRDRKKEKTKPQKRTRSKAITGKSKTGKRRTR